MLDSYPEFYCFGKSNAQSRSTRNSNDLRKQISSLNVSLTDNNRINAEVNPQHKETGSTVESKSEDFIDKALDNSIKLPTDVEDIYKHSEIQCRPSRKSCIAVDCQSG